MKHANMKWHKNITNVDTGILPKTEDCDEGVTLYAGPSHIWVNKVCAPYKGPINLHSFRLFCSGVPVSTIRRKVLILFIALDNAVSSFFNIWPSSHTTRSGPENGYNYKYNRTMTKVTISSQYHTYSCTIHIFLYKCINKIAKAYCVHLAEDLCMTWWHLCSLIIHDWNSVILKNA